MSSILNVALVQEAGANRTPASGVDVVIAEETF